MPVMDSRSGREGYLATAIFPIFEHVYDITEFQHSAGRVPCGLDLGGIAPLSRGVERWMCFG